MKNIYISQNVNQTYDFAGKLAQKFRGGEVIAMHGELGSGKTVMASAIIQYFCGARRVLSPTFIIVRHYRAEHLQIKHLLHADLYRLENIKEIEVLGLWEFMNKSDSVVIIEWAEKMGKLLPKNKIDVTIRVINSHKREIYLQQK